VAVPHFCNIGVLHTNLAGISDHANYAPCSLETLTTKGYQYWALGHVHNRQVLCRDPYIVYPGNIQGRHGKEQGEKSCELVNVSDSFAISLKTIPTSVVPWLEIDLDATTCSSAEEVYESLRNALTKQSAQQRDRVQALRLRIFGNTDAHLQLSRNPEQVRSEAISIANECGGGLLWVERVQIATLPKLDREALLLRDDPVGEVVRIAADLRRDSASLTGWNMVEELRKKLPTDLSEGGEPVAPDSAAVTAALQEAEALLLARLSALEPL